MINLNFLSNACFFLKLHFVLKCAVKCYNCFSTLSSSLDAFSFTSLSNMCNSCFCFYCICFPSSNSPLFFRGSKKIAETRNLLHWNHVMQNCGRRTLEKKSWTWYIDSLDDFLPVNTLDSLWVTKNQCKRQAFIMCKISVLK